MIGLNMRGVFCVMIMLIYYRYMIIMIGLFLGRTCFDYTDRYPQY
jgi:hypothetical protein